MTDTPKPDKGFDPTRYLVKVKGNDYLPVVARIAWFRDRFPNGTIDTEILHLDMQARSAIVKATVVAISSEGQVLGRATGIKEGTPNGPITDFVELGETGSIGRAMASLGLGTLQTGTELDEGEAIADSPVSRGNQRQDAPQQMTGSRQAAARPNNGGATEKQVAAIYGIAKGLGWSKDQLVEWLSGTPPEELDGRRASDAIGDLNKAKDQGRPRSTAEEMDAALASSTPTSLPFNVPDDRYTR